jgi:hypothetical protein
MDLFPFLLFSFFLCTYSDVVMISCFKKGVIKKRKESSKINGDIIQSRKWYEKGYYYKASIFSFLLICFFPENLVLYKGKQKCDLSLTNNLSIQN